MTDQVLLPALAAELRVVVGKLRRRLRQEAHLGDFTPSQVAALTHLERAEALTVTALARAEGVRPQSMGATVASLEVLGCVSGSADPTDGRQTLWALTTLFRTRLSASRAAREDWLADSLQMQFTLPEQAELARAAGLLRRLADLAHTAPEGEPKCP
ncbi:MarR family transcriptional regulator [Deinococcus rubellus]|uniref:MarR family transcriptional regulator n=1 Tax=Deinococcus rubellus TaxID=1889240 RepID=A0ABY5YF00_9DEIO|nr:MarR family transcriptional regulator [Deinococcus rubellus]UWX62874.1 MarR family transcriptional regulator [Deinococcus rubellus]